MPAIKGTSIAPRQRTSPQNGLPELVPYVYGQQTRRNTYAARIARRNVQGWWQPPVPVYKQKPTQAQATGKEQGTMPPDPRSSTGKLLLRSRPGSSQVSDRHWQ